MRRSSLSPPNGWWTTAFSRRTAIIVLIVACNLSNPEGPNGKLDVQIRQQIAAEPLAQPRR